MAITNYALYMDKAFAGMLYDLSAHTVDSFAVEDADGIGTAAAVIRGTDPEQQVKAASATGDGAKVIGVTLHTHIEPPEDDKKYYPQHYTVPVVTRGRLWVQTGGAVNAGDEAHLKLADGTFVKDAVATGIEALGCGAKFITSCDKAGLAVIEIG